MSKKFVKAFKENKNDFRKRVIRVSAIVTGTIGAGVAAAAYAKNKQQEVDNNSFEEFSDTETKEAPTK